MLTCRGFDPIYILRTKYYSLRRKIDVTDDVSTTRRSDMTGYGGEEFRKVAGIGSITRPNPDGGGNGGMYHRDHRKKEDKRFAGILDDERASIKEVGDISVKNTVYSPKGITQSFMVEMRDYTFQKTL